MYKIIVLCAVFVAAAADFIPLQEVCRTTEGNLGLCVTQPFCCTNLGGNIETEAKQSGVLGGSMPEYLARSIGEEDGNKGCSYQGQCCVFPEIENYSCDICGLKGNGDITKESAEDTTTPAPVVTEAPEKLITERIVNGKNADRYEWCWQVALMNDTGLFGGGALIARNWVVTAAHKVAGRFLDEFVVVLGEYDFAHAQTGARVYYSTALNVFLNPGFNPETFDFNIALIRIPDAPCNEGDSSEENSVCAVCLNDEPITFEPTTTTTTGASTTTIFTTTTEATTTYAYGGSSSNRLTASFSISNSLMAVVRNQARRVGTGGAAIIDTTGAGGFNPFADKACYMTGWGSTGQTQLAPVLQEARMAIIRDDDCQAAFESVGVADPYIPEGSFCGADASLTRGSCYGDGGGPLVCQNKADHTWELYGVISLGTNMCMTGGQSGPTIYTDVGEHFEWIVETIHDTLPNPADDEDQGKTYKVPECGADVINVGQEGCPDSPPYESLNRRGGVPYTGRISMQQLNVVSQY